MLSAGIVIVLLAIATGVAVWAKFSWSSLFILAGVFEVMGLVLLGLPGAGFLETIEPIMRRAGRPAISADGAWPAAIVMSLAWPIALAPAYLVARSVRMTNGARGLVAFAVLTFTSFLLAVLVYGMAT